MPYAEANNQHEYAKERANERRDWMRAYKLAHGCVDCGYNENSEALEFDHGRGEKYKRLSRMATHSWEQIFAEIEKCEARCANCHAVVTATRRKELVKS